MKSGVKCTMRMLMGEHMEGIVKKGKGRTTMSDLISREALVREVLGLTIVSQEVMNYANAVAVAIVDAPSVDAVEVVHGRWINEKCDHVPWRIKNPEKWVIHKCSVCGYSNGRKHSNYCPNCGAKMDGGAEDG